MTIAAFALLVAFARRVDWADTWTAMRRASLPLLALATGVNFASLAVKGVRWWIFLRPVTGGSPWLAIRATAAGAGLNNLLVANGGDAARVVFVSRSTGLPSSTVLATLALERLFDAVGYVILLVASALVIPLPPDLARYRGAGGLLLLAIAVGLIALARRGPAAVPAAAGVAEVALDVGAWQRVGSYFRSFARSVGELSSAPRFVGALGLSLVAWGCQLACFGFTARAAGWPLPLAGNLAALLAVNAGLLIRATPGNVGVFQLAYVLAAGRFGMREETAVAVSLLIQTLQIIPTTALGALLAPEFLLRRGGRGALPAA